jgi:hypothetical protein
MFCVHGGVNLLFSENAKFCYLLIYRKHRSRNNNNNNDDTQYTRFCSWFIPREAQKLLPAD